MRFCRFCGTTEIQFRKSGKFGCIHCVSNFEFPKPKKNKIIPKNLREDLANFVKENTNHLSLLSFRTRITRNLKSNLFPFYETFEDKSKRLLVDNKMDVYLYPDGFFSNPPRTAEPERAMGFYLGSEDHIRWESIWVFPPKNSLFFPLREKKKISIFRFLFQKSHWAHVPEWGFVSSCPTNLGMGRRDSVLLGVDPELAIRFFSNLQTLSEFGIEFAPSTDHRFRNIGKDRVLIVKISWKNASVVQKRQFYKILGLLGSY